MKNIIIIITVTMLSVYLSACDAQYTSQRAKETPDIGASGATHTAGSAESEVRAALITVTLDATDLESAAQERLPTVTVHGPASTATLETLRASIRLETWPEGQAVPVRTLSSALSEQGAVRLSLEPQAKLEDRWYAVRVPALPTGLGWPEVTSLYVEQEGTVAARFRPGSDPRVSRVELCDKGDAITAAVVFSEGVTLGSRSAISLSESASPSQSCIAVTDGSTSGSTNVESGRNAFHFTCSPNGRAGVDLRLPRGIRAASGREVGEGSFHLSWSGMDPVGDCVTATLDEAI